MVWAHLVGGYLTQSGMSWPVSTAVDRLIFGPLAITQHGGFLGVALFFLVSGYIITRVAQRENAVEFSLKRLLRIYPPLIVAVALSVVIDASISGWTAESPTLLHIVTNMTLINYVLVPQIVLVGVAWSLVVEVVFYALTLATRRLLVSPAVALQPLVLLAVASVMIITAGDFGDSWFLFAVSFLYIPLLVLGSLFALGEKRLIAPFPLVVLGSSAWATFLLGTERFYPAFLHPDGSYPISAIAGLLLFSSGYLLRSRIPRIRVISAIAQTSYSIYLLHGIVGLTIIRFVAPGWGYVPALVIGLAVTAAASAGSYLLIERPSQRTGAALTQRMRTGINRRLAMSTNERDTLHEPDLVHAKHHDGDRQ